MMKPSFYNLVIVSSGDPQIVKFHISRKAIMVLLIAFFVSFVVTVAVGYSIAHRQMSSDEQLRLRTENQALEVENKNAAIRNQKLQAQLDNLEKISQHVTTLMESD